MSKSIVSVLLFLAAAVCLSMAVDAGQRKRQPAPKPKTTTLTLAWEDSNAPGTVTYDVENRTQKLVWQNADVRIAASSKWGASLRFTVPSPPSTAKDSFWVRACYKRSRTCSSWSGMDMGLRAAR